MVRVQKCNLFLGPKSRVLAKKSDFCHTTPILVNGPFVALGEAVHFPPWEQIFDFPFRSYSSFRKKKSGGPVKKSSPSSLWGHRLPVTALALSARRPFGLIKTLQVAVAYSSLRHLNRDVVKGLGANIHQTFGFRLWWKPKSENYSMSWLSWSWSLQSGSLI